jgi:DNA-binding NtrC family response regulator
MPTIRLEPNALDILINYPWKGNIRQLRNITEQISVIEQDRSISREMLKSYLPDYNTNLPALINNGSSGGDFANEREILYKVLFDMRNDITDLKKLTLELLEDNNDIQTKKNTKRLIEKIYGDEQTEEENLVEIISPQKSKVYQQKTTNFDGDFQDAEAVEETISLQEKEFEMIKNSLERNNNKRKLAAKELGISERTLYRKIKQFDL